MESELRKKENTSVQCREIAPLLTEYIDGRLSANETWRIKNHVTVCASCSAAVRQTNAVAEMLRAAQKYEAPASFAASLESRISAAPRKTGPASFLRRFLTRIYGGSPAAVQSLTAPVAAAVMALVFAAIIFTHPISQAPPDKAPTPISVTGDMPDPSVVETCVNQHRNQTAEDPMADTSAELLASTVDTIPYDQSKTQTLSDDDAAVLLDEEM